MSNLLAKIPVLRSLKRYWIKYSFDKEWRRRNPHNDTIIGSRMFPMEVVTVGKGTYGDITVQSLYVTDNERLEIGNYVSIAPEVTFFLGVNHQIDTVTTYPFYSKLIERSPVDAISKGPIHVDDEVWIGTGARIFSGVRIGKAAIIAAGSIVTHDVPPYAIVGGNPAKLIRYRFSKEIIEELLPYRLADFPPAWIKEHINEIYSPLHSIEDARRIKVLFDSFKKTK